MALLLGVGDALPETLLLTVELADARREGEELPDWDVEVDAEPVREGEPVAESVRAPVALRDGLPVEDGDTDGVREPLADADGARERDEEPVSDGVREADAVADAHAEDDGDARGENDDVAERVGTCEDVDVALATSDAVDVELVRCATDRVGRGGSVALETDDCDSRGVAECDAEPVGEEEGDPDVDGLLVLEAPEEALEVALTLPDTTAETVAALVEESDAGCEREPLLVPVAGGDREGAEVDDSDPHALAVAVGVSVTHAVDDALRVGVELSLLVALLLFETDGLELPVRDAEGVLLLQEVGEADKQCVGVELARALGVEHAETTGDAEGVAVCVGGEDGDGDGTDVRDCDGGADGVRDDDAQGDDERDGESVAQVVALGVGAGDADRSVVGVNDAVTDAEGHAVEEGDRHDVGDGVVESDSDGVVVSVVDAHTLDEEDCDRDGEDDAQRDGGRVAVGGAVVDASVVAIGDDAGERDVDGQGEYDGEGEATVLEVGDKDAVKFALRVAFLVGGKGD